MILSDRSIHEELAAGRIVIEPLREEYIQPSSVDLTLDRYFRVFLNHSYRVIDVKEDQEDLTELIEVKGDEAFILHPGEFVLGSTIERVKLPNDIVARLEGKALAFDTPVATTRGFKTMETIEVGDLVFGLDGSPTPVVAMTDLMLDRPCARVVFSDGYEIVADFAHQWVTASKYDRRIGRTRVVTTAQVAATLKEGREFRHHVPIAGPVQFPTKALPVDPYVLGVWLGDGTSTKAEITCADPEILAEIERAGYRVAPATSPLAWRIGGMERRTRDSAGRYASDGSLSSTLRALGLLGDKHVPRDYFTADVDQRLALLQGFMDSDGYCDEFGRCEFVSTKEHLADAVVKLASSLSLRPVKRKKTAYLNGIDCGPAYQVKFTPDRPVFRLPRKLARQKPATARFHRFRSIVSVESTWSVPVKCIQVAAPDGVFLAGTRFIPTHNSSLGRLGLLIHSTAGFVDAGWDGQLTLELSNVANLPITLYPGMKIGQISFLQMTTAAEIPYGSKAVGSKYQGQRGPRPSRYFENFRESGQQDQEG